MSLRPVFACLAAAALVFVAPSPASADVVFTLDGIPGTSTLAKAPPNSIAATSIKIGAASSGAAGAAANARGRATSTELVITRRADRASPALVRATTTGQRFRTLSAYVISRSGGGTATTYRVTVNDAQITSFRHTAGDNDSTPNEELTVEFASGEMELYSSDAKGALVSAGKVPLPGRKP